MPGDRRPITIEDLYKITYAEEPQISRDGRWIAYVQVTVDKLENGYKRDIWLAATDGGKPIQLTRSGKDSNPRWSPDSTTLAFVSGRDKKSQIYLIRVTAPGGEARALTSMPNGATAPAWSPDGTRIAFLAPMNAEERAKEEGEEEALPTDKFEAEQRKARKEHDEQKRWDPRPVWRIPYRQGTSFMDDRYAQVYVMRVEEGLEKGEAKPRRLTDVDADHDAPEWTPDGRYLLTARTIDPTRDLPWRWATLYRIDVESGASEQLTDESHADARPLPSPDGQWVAYVRRPVERMAERIARLAVIPSTGGESRDLNLEFDRSVEVFKWSPDSETLVFSAGDRGSTEIYRVTLADCRVEKVIGGDMQVDAFDMGKDGDGSIAYCAGTPVTLPELYWRPSDASESQPLTTANQKFMDEIIVQETHELRFLGPDGQELQGWYVLPVGYEEGKTYPLALNIHGGPHVMWGPSYKSMWHEFQVFAARGYMVFYANPRGSDGYGESFMSSLHGAWGEAAFADLMAGVDALAKQGFVDSGRMAVTGGSYGGYMTAWMAAHTDRFKAAVAHRGVYNLVSFYGTSDVPLLITNEFDVEPWEDAALLWAHSPLAHAHKIKTPLLIMHAENDFRAPMADAEQLFTFVRRSGGTVKLVRYPREGHELTRSGEPEHRVSSMTQMLNWFDQYCMEA